jgi:hypothetical protein
MWWPDSWNQSVSELARYDYIGWGSWENELTLKKLKTKNPNQLHFMSINLTETDWRDWENKPIMSEIVAEWFLTQVGSALKEDINETQINITVNETRDIYGDPLFEEGDTLVCGVESMKVITVDHETSVLIVERGFIRSASSHGAGERVAAHISFWPKTWVMNKSTLCPEYDVGYGPEQWLDWAFRNNLNINTMDGLIIDRMEDTQSWLVENRARNIDPDCSNKLVNDGYEMFDLAWEEGIRQLLPKVRELLNGKPLIANSFGAYQDLLNGSIYESFPGNWSETIPETYGDWEKKMLGLEGYINVSNDGYMPNFSLVETYDIEDYFENSPMDDPSFVPNYQRMRWGITTALLGNGYFSYELSLSGHGVFGLLWFDEYDNAGLKKGYLGYPTSDAYIIQDYGQDGKVFRRNFDNGIVICNPSERETTITLERSYKLIKGTQVSTINTGKWVTFITVAPKDGRILLKN